MTTPPELLRRAADGLIAFLDIGTCPYGHDREAFRRDATALRRLAKALEEPTEGMALAYWRVSGAGGASKKGLAAAIAAASGEGTP